jgi:HAD superfamily hydrolase (TIGR01549 family)
MSASVYIIFDFDGTLADTFASGAALLNNYAEKFGYNKIDFENNRNLSARELIKLSGVRFWKIPHLIRFFRKKSAENASQIKAFEGMPELLKKFFDAGFSLGIITTNTSETVTVFLKKYGLEKYFSYIETDVPLFGKKRAVKRAKRRLKSEILYVGDEQRDIEAAKAAGVNIVSVVWGFNSAEVLEKFNAGKVAFSPDGIFSLAAEILKI